MTKLKELLAPYRSLTAGYWIRQTLHGLISGYVSLMALSSAGVANAATSIWVTLGLALFPLSGYWIAGQQQLIVVQHRSDLATVWDRRRKLENNVVPYLMLKLLRIVAWVAGGVVTIIVWPLVLAVSLQKISTHHRDWRLTRDVPFRMFKGQLNDPALEALWENTYGFPISRLWAIVKKIDAGKRLDPEQQGWANRLRLYDVYEHSQRN